MYFDFSKYQFLDVLDALSFRVMVIDHMKRQHGEKAEIELDLMDPEEEMRIKQELQKEINKLIFQRKSEGIMAVQDMLMREMKQVSIKDSKKDVNGLSSSHHMAAEATVRRMRRFLDGCRQERMN